VLKSFSTSLSRAKIFFTLLPVVQMSSGRESPVFSEESDRSVRQFEQLERDAHALATEEGGEAPLPTPIPLKPSDREPFITLNAERLYSSPSCSDELWQRS